MSQRLFWNIKIVMAVCFALFLLACGSASTPPGQATVTFTLIKGLNLASNNTTEIIVDFVENNVPDNSRKIRYAALTDSGMQQAHSLDQVKWTVTAYRIDTPDNPYSLSLDLRDSSNVSIYVYTTDDNPTLRITSLTDASYPRESTSSILQQSPPLAEIPSTPGPIAVKILDWSTKNENGTEENLIAAEHLISPWAIPAEITEEIPAVTDTGLLILAGNLASTQDISSAEIDTLDAYVQAGSTVFLWRPTQAALLEKLGLTITASTVDTNLRPVSWVQSKADPIMSYIDHPAEIDWQFNLPEFGTSKHYQVDSGTVLATWSDGGAAVIRLPRGTGSYYVFGWQLRHSITQSEQEILYGDHENNRNIFRPDSDLIKLLARGVYEELAQTSVPRNFAPGNHQAALIVTHDVDATSSYQRIVEFSEWEQARGFNSTFTVTVSPFKTGWAGYLYTETGKKSISTALEMGADIQSHSIGHFPDFDLIEKGDGTETASNYAPYYDIHEAAAINASVFGEVGVSRWILNQDFSLAIESFRAGHLVYPETLFEVLAQTGYKRDSSFTAPSTSGSLPYETFDADSGLVTRYPITEYPISISDTGLDGSNYEEIAESWFAVLEANYANNVPTMLLLHNSDKEGKLEAMQHLLDLIEADNLDLWIGNWKEFAQFWESQGMVYGQ